MLRVRLVGVLSGWVAAIVTLTAAPVRAQDVRACIHSHVRMQELFSTSKLLAAREAAAACAVPHCPDEVRAECEAFVKKVDADTPRIIVRVTGASTEARGYVEVDDEIVLPRLEARPIRVDPGTHAVRVELEDGTSARANVTIERGRTRSVLLRLPQPAATSGTAADAADDGGSASRLSPPVLIAGGIGVAGLVVGSYFGLKAISLKNDADEQCPSDDRCYAEGIRLRDDASGAATISTIAFAVGVAGLGTAVTLVVLAPGGSGEAALVRLQGTF